MNSQNPDRKEVIRMKKYILIAVMALSLAVIPWIAAYASESEEHHEMMKNVKKEVEKIENGVIVKITSDNPEAVRRIQERAAGHKDMRPCRDGGHKHSHGEKDHHS